MNKVIFTSAIIATTLIATPALAQTAYENCKTNDTQSQVLGAVIGGSLGAVLGNEISGDTGAVVGGLAGGTAGVAIANKDCEQYRARSYDQRAPRGVVRSQESVTYDRYGNRVVTHTTTTTEAPRASRGKKNGHYKNGKTRVYDARTNSYYYTN